MESTVDFGMTAVGRVEGEFSVQLLQSGDRDPDVMSCSSSLSFSLEYALPPCLVTTGQVDAFRLNCMMLWLPMSTMSVPNEVRDDLTSDVLVNVTLSFSRRNVP